ncbi:MAG: hypothetical protein WBM29_01695, partial [Candidatus Deferrimicrobium sp.]
GEYGELAKRSWSGCSGARMPGYLRDAALVPREGWRPGHGKLATSVGKFPHIPKSRNATNFRNIHKIPTIKGIFLKLFVMQMVSNLLP